MGRPDRSKQNPPRIPLGLIMSAYPIHKDAISAVFYAVIINPDNGKVIRRIPIYRAQPGESVELSVERKSIFEDGRTGVDPVVPGDAE